MQPIESTIKSFNEINNDKKLDDLIGSAVVYAKSCTVNAEVNFIKYAQSIPKELTTILKRQQTLISLNFIVKNLEWH